MPPKQKKVYVCKECGYESPKWNGRCPNCEAWNSFEEEVRTPTAAASGLCGKAPAQVAHAYQPLRLRDVDFGDEARYDTGIGELNRVLGGGLVKGSVVLLSGDPGIGKSPLLLQICAHLGQAFS